MRTSVVRVLIGSILLIASIAKSSYLLSASVNPYSLDFQWYLMVISVAIEVFLGLWLLSGAYDYISMQLTLFVFIAFAVIALAKWLNGSITCGCFGEIQVPPFLTLLFDIVIAVILITTLKLRWTQTRPPRQQRDFLLLASFLVLSAGIGLYIYSSATGLARHLVFHENRFDFGESSQNQSLNHEFVMENRASYPVEVVQAQSNCGCTVAKNMNGVIVSPNETLAIPVVLKTGQGEDELSALVSIFCRRYGSNEVPLLAQHLRVITSIQPEYWVRPQILDFGHVEGNDRVVKQFRIRKNKLSELKIDVISTTHQAFSAKILEATNEVDFDIEVSLDPAKVHHRGGIESKIEITTNALIKPSSTVIVRGFINPTV